MMYKNSSLPIKERVDDLMSRMSIKQKIDQITCLFTSGKGIPDFKSLVPNGIGNVGAMSVADNVRQIAEYSYCLQKYLVENTEFGIPAILHVEAIAGGLFTGATVFPTAIGQASTWDPNIVTEMTNIIRKQMLAVGFRQALSPVFDIARDPRWGRLSETYGEDPTLAAAMGSAFVRGLQGKDDKSAIIATGKHFVGHGASEGGLNMAQSIVSERVLREVHCKPFQAAITEAGLMSVMNSYGMLNNEPVTSSKYVLTDLLRGELGFDGIVVSDYISMDRLVDPFCTAETYEDAGKKGLIAGIDVEYPKPTCFNYHLEEAITSGVLATEELDKAVRRVLTIKFRLGLFENPYPELETIPNVFGSEIGNDLSLRLAQEVITLLKNDNNTLPLPKEVKKIAVIGPHADSLRSFFGTFSYPGTLDMMMTREEEDQVDPDDPDSIINHISQRHPGDIREISPRIENRIRETYPSSATLYGAIKEYLPNANVEYAMGCSPSGMNFSGMDYALRVAAGADVVILTLGGKNGWGTTSTVGEGIDSTNIGLPGKQEEFAKAVYLLNKKTVIVHFDGRPLSSEYVVSHFPAILEVWQPGQFGGKALASVLFGDYNPAGRLAVTAARSAGQIPVYYSLPRGSGYISAGHPGMIENPNGYINDTAKPLFYFGHGLSYTTFKYSDFAVSSKKISPDSSVKCSVNITNNGKYDGDEVVQLYITDVVSTMVRPEKELVGFKRVHIKKGETKKLQFDINASQFAFLDENMQWKIEAGKFELGVGSSCVDIRLIQDFEIMTDKIIDGRIRGFYAKAEIT
ncbi:MAG: glycoside hydrolase family 3 N-terminal domain-containing protein [Flexilinea sp.]